MKKTYGKIILMGEHSAVYDKLAIAIPFKKVYTTCHASYIDDIDHYIKSNFYEGYLFKSEDQIEGIKHVVDLFVNNYNVKSKIKLDIKSTVLVRRGLGSSASVAKSVTQALFKLIDVKPTEQDILYYVLESEKKYHSNPSGIDMYTIVNEKKVILENKKITVLKTKLKGYLVVADTGIKSQTKEAVNQVKQQYLNHKEDTMNKINYLDNYAKKFLEFAKNKNVVKMGQQMTLAHETLKSLGVSNDELDNLVKICLDNNALGAKLTGGGKGGCVIAYTTNLKTAKNINSNLKNKGVKNVWIYRLK